MNWIEYKKILRLLYFCVFIYAGFLLLIFLTVDYIPFLIFPTGLIFVFLLFIFGLVLLLSYDVFNQKRIHKLKLKIEMIDRIINLKKKGIIP